MLLPTPENVLEALPLIGGRISVAIDEIIRVLQVYLPDAIDAANTAYGTTIDKPVSIRVMPNDINDIDIDTIAIEWSIEKKLNGLGLFTDFGTLYIHSIDERFVEGKHTNNVQDRGDIIIGVLYFGLSGWSDPQDRRVWKELVPKTKSQLPGEFAKYSGSTITYHLTQSNDDCWTVH